jgi:hypothetical protein
MKLISKLLKENRDDVLCFGEIHRAIGLSLERRQRLVENENGSTCKSLFYYN